MRDGPQHQDILLSMHSNLNTDFSLHLLRIKANKYSLAVVDVVVLFILLLQIPFKDSILI